MKCAAVICQIDAITIAASQGRWTPDELRKIAAEMSMAAAHVESEAGIAEWLALPQDFAGGAQCYPSSN